MPRTKNVKKSTAKGPKLTEEEIKFNSIVLAMEAHFHEELSKICKVTLDKMDEAVFTVVPVSDLKKLVGELKESSKPQVVNQLVEQAESILDRTKNMPNRSKLLQNNVTGEDEGYLTTESSNGTSGRTSRVRKRSTAKPARLSRSLSTRKPAPAAVKYKTPMAKGPNPRAYAPITPKVAPCTPQVMLRRPKAGEVGLSFQGSPLYVGSGCVSETTANLHVPTRNGVLFIQPERGLRRSQVPELDESTRRQLEALRDNLNLLCDF